MVVLILCGPGEVDIYDPSPVKLTDLGCNFYLTEDDDRKKNRDDACVEKLSKCSGFHRTSSNVFD